MTTLFPNGQSSAGGAIPVWIASPAYAQKTGISSNSSVGTTSALVVPAGTFSTWVTIQNTHATQTLRVSFNNPATNSDVSIAPAGGALTLPFGVANNLYAIGSGAATTYAIIGA